MGLESLYYIMDYSNNYYRINDEDQLVVAGNKESASVFTFSQANNRICVGKRAAFYCIVPAEEECAETEQISSVKELVCEEVKESIEKTVSSYDLEEMDWAEYLTHFAYVASSVSNYRDELAKKHSEVEQKICDILHYIELCEIDENEAGDLVELLRVCRENRREIKDELRRTEYFQTHLGTSANVTKAKQALKAVRGLENRKYKPRKYEELFENSTMKTKRLKKEEMYAVDSKRKQYSVRYTYRKESDEIMMTEERSYTPFDGKENDWLSFAKQQAEFYRNAGQYIANIQIALEEIDREIESVLREAEDANCNVTQGYKVFKRLKELRLEKKKNTQELNCLYALTDYIDCDALADTCEENLNEIEDIMKAGDNVVKTQLAEVVREEQCMLENVQDMVS